MDPARSLHSVFTDLTGERGYAEASGLAPDEVLAAGGHPDLPEGLVAEAVVSYADTAPFEVAEHLAPYVRVNSAVPQAGAPASGEEPHWYALLTTAPPAAALVGGPDALDAEANALAGTGAGVAPAPDAPADLEFGHGHRGPTEQTAAGDDSAAEAMPSWSASPQPGFEPPGVDSGTDLDLRALPGEHPEAADGDEPDDLDGI
jgi:hypothetical protein